MKGMTTIVKNISTIMRVPIFLFGLYLVAFGHSGPGGGFAGGVIFASVYVLLLLAFGRDFAASILPPSVALKISCFATLCFTATALAGLWYGKDAFFWNFLHQNHPEFLESGIIALAEFFFALIVASLTYLILFYLFAYRVETSEENGS
jgi:multicomponent Na+:H+ antiporter subunit B